VGEKNQLQKWVGEMPQFPEMLQNATNLLRDATES
jgi:hypothetical protein